MSFSGIGSDKDYLETLTWREHDILSLLAKRRTNKEIAQNLGIELTTVKWYNKQIFSKLMVGSRYQAVARAKELGILKDPDELVPLTTSKQNNNLPLKLTSFIGRQQDLANVIKLLEDARLLTLTGPGGVGKTRLAIQVAGELVNRFPDGRYFVDLSPVTDPNNVANAIIETLDIRKTPQRSVERTLTDYLGEKELLLIIDNFEHLLGAANLIMDLLHSAPQLTILITSREALQVYGEREYHVNPLNVPNLNTVSSSQDLIGHEAVALFCQRVRGFDLNFSPTDEDLVTIGKLCAQLDGLPLAIELAASQVKMYSPAALLEQLTNRFTSLKGTPRDLPSRHKTLQSLLEWSYDLLDAEEKKIFYRLSIFTGDFTLEAAGIVAQKGESRRISDLVSSLLNKNLLTKSFIEGKKHLGNETRFMMLNTIQAFAKERLMESGETQDVLKRHASYFAEFIGPANPDLAGDEQVLWLNSLTKEYKNIDQALQWAFDGNDIPTGLKMVSALGYYWRNKYRLFQGWQWLNTALEFAEQANEADLGNIYENAGYIATTLGNTTEGISYLENALQILQNLGDTSRIAGLLINLSHPTLGLDNFSITKTIEGIEFARQIGDKRQVAHGLNVLGEIYRLQNDYEAAKQAYKECLQLAREVNDKIRELFNIGNLAMVAFNQEDFQLARRYGLEAYKLALEIKSDYIIAEGLTFNGGILAAMGHLETGTKLLGAGEKQLVDIGAKSQHTDQVEFDKMEKLIRSQVDDDTFERWYEEGKKLPLEAAIKLVLQEV